MPSEPEMIPSRNELFEGLLIPKPPKAKFLLHDADGWDILKCPHCGEAIHEVHDTDVLGAEPGCAFCNKCNKEIEL